MAVLKDTRFFDTKREVVSILSAHFHALQLELIEQWNAAELHHRFASPAPKIFKGENYKGYPYLNMDFPRVFGTESIFAFRSMTWWGHPFSFTLHLQGEAYSALAGRLIVNINKLKGKGYYVCVNTSPWEYHFGRDNYLPIDEINLSDVPFNPGDKKSFIKLSRRLNLDDYQAIVPFGSETFRELISCLD